MITTITERKNPMKPECVLIRLKSSSPWGSNHAIMIAHAKAAKKKTHGNRMSKRLSIENTFSLLSCAIVGSKLFKNISQFFG